ncbi:helix-turn-helix domain-containing protein [Alicyclobacillus sp. ALC3]|uniref:helix-turn-helix domain-containing protein n=1 Tax=Alicyclobacillus sp. ALC3 TaxID=2796143 RepID=UPI002378E449|nr:helix-turn-helix domain-containing protein [Alicyclobacillus sp. ALC3]WDL97817.1 helix-turn-helix domain-containing protein [Alicyclobacillus sp. ALC3]
MSALDPAMDRANRADRSAERTMVNSRRSLYLAGEDMDLVWSVADVRKFDAAWRDDVPLAEIAEVLGRDADEVAILAIDRARRGRIQPRAGGVFGKAVRLC